MTPTAGPGSLLVVTDLDGSLLDEATYGYEPARPALQALARRGAGLVLASSKTRAEMEPLARDIGLQPALIVENGGAILIPRGDGSYDAVARGVPRPVLVQALAEIAHETGARLRGFSSLSAQQLSALTGLSPDAARRALAREWSEPFLLEDADRAHAVEAAAARRSLRVTRGGRFHHLGGASDKGRALKDLLAYFARRGRRFRSVGLGDAPNDLPFLRVVGRPILLPHGDGRFDPELEAALPGAERAPAPGPAGWNAAVLAVLHGGRLERAVEEPA